MNPLPHHILLGSGLTTIINDSTPREKQYFSQQSVFALPHPKNHSSHIPNIRYRTRKKMELEVRVVGGIETCFVSLPVSLIQTLESTTASGYLPPILALELRSPQNANQLWRVAWSGSASSHPFPNSIQVHTPQFLKFC